MRIALMSCKLARSTTTRLRKSCMRQRVSNGMPYELSRFRIANEVALLASLALFPLRIPMPRFDVQLCVLPVRDGLPARGKNFFQHGLGKNLVRCCERN